MSHGQGVSVLIGRSEGEARGLMTRRAGVMSFPLFLRPMIVWVCMYWLRVLEMAIYGTSVRRPAKFVALCHGRNEGVGRRFK